MAEATAKEDLDAAVRMGERIFELEAELTKAREELRVHRAARDSILSCANAVASSAETFDAEALESVLGQRIWDESFVVADGESMRRWIARSIDLDRELRARDEARAALGEAWLSDGATLAEGIQRKMRALESMPGARALALVDAVLTSHRDDIPPRIRDLAEAVQPEVDAAEEHDAPLLAAERPIAYWTCDDSEERLHHTDIDDAVEAWLDQADIDWDDEDATVTVYGFARMEVSWCPESMLARALWDIDEDLADPDGKPTEPTPAMVAAAEEFARVLEREYESWACEQVTKREVPVLAWVREHAPHWLPTAGVEGGAA